MKYVASVSFGKDSLAMLLKIIEEKMPLDEVVFYDTGMEFKAIYETRDRIKEILSELKIPFKQLEPEKPFEWFMFEKEVKGRNGVHFGYSWCGGVCRWGTTAKMKAIDEYCGKNIQYIGIASDEPQRIEKERKPEKILPLVDWKMTEEDCLKYCYEKGFYWEENGFRLYDVLDRVSCWCCANKNLKELRNYKAKLPEYWEKLKELQKKTEIPFKGIGVFELDERFEKEGKQGVLF